MANADAPVGRMRVLISDMICACGHRIVRRRLWRARVASPSCSSPRCRPCCCPCRPSPCQPNQKNAITPPDTRSDLPLIQAYEGARYQIARCSYHPPSPQKVPQEFRISLMHRSFRIFNYHYAPTSRSHLKSKFTTTDGRRQTIDDRQQTTDDRW